MIRLTRIRTVAAVQVALVVEDGGRGAPELREALAAFVDKLSGRADVALYSASRNVPPIAGYTSDRDALRQAIDALAPNRVQQIALRDQLLEISRHAATRPAPRAIVVAAWGFTSCREGRDPDAAGGCTADDRQRSMIRVETALDQLIQAPARIQPAVP
jgi:hypothetical protein